MTRAVRMAVVVSVWVIVASALTGCKCLSAPPLESYAATLPATETPPQGLHARFFGTSTLLIGDGKNAIMVDGFFSRPGLLELVRGLGKIQPDQRRIDHALTSGDVGRIDVLLVAHSHHDHAMDAATVAKQKGALLVGSESTWNIALGAGPDLPRFDLIKEGIPLASGAFTISAFASPHSPATFEFLERRLAGKIDKPLHTPAHISDYKFGGNYTFLIAHDEAGILVVPSAKAPLGLPEARVDVVFLSIGNLDLLSNAEVLAYWQDAVVDTGASLVIPIHWDNFGRSLGKRLKPLPYFIDDTACSMETLKRLAGDRVLIEFMPLFGPVRLPEHIARAQARRASSPIRAAFDPFISGCRAGRG